MSTCQEVIRSAYRRSGIVGLGVTPNAAQSVVGLERLQELYSRMLSTGLLGRLTDFYLASDNYIALEWQRIYKQSSGSVVTFPSSYDMNVNGGNPNDYGFAGSQLIGSLEQTGGGINKASDGGTRAPLDGAVVQVIDASTTPFTTITKIYDAMHGWVQIDSLTANSYAPLTLKNDAHIKNLLAVDLVDENGMQVTPILAKNAISARMYFTSRYDQPRAPGRAEYM